MDYLLLIKCIHIWLLQKEEEEKEEEERCIFIMTWEIYKTLETVAVLLLPKKWFITNSEYHFKIIYHSNNYIHFELSLQFI